MFEPLQIAPSILSADFAKLGRDVRLVEEAGAGMVHVDVMDGHFVPNLSMGVPVVKCLKRATSLPLDVHLMIDNPLVQLPWFLDAGADSVTLHVEAFDAPEDVHAALRLAREAGARAALSIKPATPPEALAPILAGVDMVLVMSVEPGFSGQGYIEGSEGARRARGAACPPGGRAPLLQVDGGIGPKTAARVAAAGADVLVCGNAVFGAPGPRPRAGRDSLHRQRRPRAGACRRSGLRGRPPRRTAATAQVPPARASRAHRERAFPPARRRRGPPRGGEFPPARPALRDGEAAAHEGVFRRGVRVP